MIKVIQGDITKIPVDAIVNAANSSLAGGGGVDGAIHRAGGKAIYDECAKIGGCLTGHAAITGAGNLPAKYVIHAVGPVWRGGDRNEDELLASAYRNSLKLAAGNNVQKISFPNISTGVYGFPKERAARIAVSEVTEFLKDNDRIKEVIFVCFESDNFEIYSKMIEV